MFLDTRTAGRGRLLAALAATALSLGAAGYWWFGRSAGVPDPASIESRLAARDYRGAAAEAERLVAAEPRDARAWHLLARARAGSGDLDGAVVALRRIPEWSLRKGEALFFEGQILKQLRRGREAEAAFREYLARAARGEPAPLATNARLELMPLYAMEERFDEFRDVFWQAYPDLNPTDRIESLTMRMRSEFEQTKPEQNIEMLESFVAADPEDAAALAGLAAAHDHAGRLDETVRLLGRARAMRPDDVHIRTRYLDALYRSGDQQALVEALASESPEAAPTASIANLLGIAAQARGDLETAAAGFARAVALRPDVAEYHHRLAQTLGRLGRGEEAALHAGERTRLTSAREALRKAWNGFADAYEKDPAAVPADRLWAMSEACQAASWPREADAWASLAREAAARRETR